MWDLEAKRKPYNLAVVEADICGAGASGRNGGFAMNWWSKFLSLRKLCGPEAALELGERSVRAVAQIGEFCEQRGLDGCFEQLVMVGARDPVKDEASQRQIRIEALKAQNRRRSFANL